MPLAALAGMSAIFWLSVFITVGALSVAGELGYLIARRTPPELVERRKGPVGVAVAALLVLLALLLGFTFSMVNERYAARKALVIEEANAISTAYLRATLLPEPHASRAELVFREYVALRSVNPTARTLGPGLVRTQELQRALWDEARAVATRDPRSHVTALFVASLNHAIDAHQARVDVSYHQRLPEPIRLLLYVAALLTLGVVGFNAGLAGTRALFAMCSLVLAVSIVMTVIIELNRPLHAIGHVELAPYRDVQQQIANPADAGRAAPPETSIVR